MEPVKKKEEGYGMYVLTFISLTILTLLAVGLTRVRFDTPLLMTIVLIIATIQAAIVLAYNMHLKFNDKILTIFVSVIFALIFLTIVITLVDYIYR